MATSDAWSPYGQSKAGKYLKFMPNTPAIKLGTRIIAPQLVIFFMVMLRLLEIAVR